MWTSIFFHEIELKQIGVATNKVKFEFSDALSNKFYSKQDRLDKMKAG